VVRECLEEAVAGVCIVHSRRMRPSGVDLRGGETGFHRILSPLRVRPRAGVARVGWHRAVVAAPVLHGLAGEALWLKRAARRQGAR
jgi:hypothetical protein